MGLVEGGCQLGAAVTRHDVGIFGGGDKAGTAGSGLAYQGRGRANILRHVIAGAELDTGSLKGSRTGHAVSITDPALKTRKLSVLAGDLGKAGADADFVLVAA